MLGFFKKKKKTKKTKKDDIKENKSLEKLEAPVANQQSNDDQSNNSDDNKKNAKVDKNDMMSAAMAGMMGGGGDIKEMLKNIDTSGMSLKEKMGLKMLQKMPRKKQEEILRQALNPQELYKNKDKVLEQIDAMVASGQIEKGQAEAVKAQMGLR
jgi:hypothetical protein